MLLRFIKLSTARVSLPFVSRTPLAVTWRSASTEERWTCNCGFSNFSFRGACFNCQSPNPKPASTPPVTELSSLDFDEKDRINGHFGTGEKRNQEFLSGDWECGCGANNFARRMNCYSCGAKKNGKVKFMLKPGDWICLSCQSHNFSSRTSCINCKVPKPQLPGAHSVTQNVGSICAPTPWTCSSCHSINEAAANACHVCTAVRPKDAPSAPPAATAYPNDWNCPGCNFLNFQSRILCKNCGQQKPNSSPGMETGTHSPLKERREKDWACECGYVNFEFRNACKACHRHKPLVGPPSGNPLEGTQDL